MLSRQRPFAEAWHDYRRRRYLVWFSWGLFLALAVGLPALSRYVQSDVPLVVAGAAAMTLMCASRIYATLFRCPRCGSFFHVSLFPGFPGNDSRGGLYRPCTRTLWAANICFGEPNSSSEAA